VRARIRDVLTGLVAIVALAAIIIGLPVVLYHYGGSPLPRHLASWHRFAAIMTGRDNGWMLLAVVRDCSWLAWLLFTFSVLAAARAAIRGDRGPRLRLGGLQSVAARLVTLAALTFAASPALTQVASAAVVSTQHGAASPIPDSVAGTRHGAALTVRGRATAPTARPPDSASQGLPAAVAAATSATKLLTVRHGDCLWSIAQRYLESGERYPEIAGLNYGRDMGDGQVFTNPSLIEPGWRLIMPAHGETASAPAGQASAKAGSAAGTAAGINTSAGHLGHASGDPYYRRRHSAAGHKPRTAPADRDQNSGGAPAAGRTGGALGVTGASDGPTQAGQAGNQPSAARIATAATDGGPSREGDVRPPASGFLAGNQLAAIGAFATGALAGSILTRLSAMRRGQRLERHAGRRIALSADPEVMATEQQLRAAEPAEATGPLRTALACLQAAIAAAGQGLPDILGLHVTPEVLEVLLSAPAAESPPAPYRISPGRQGMCWQLEIAALAEHENGGCHILPGLFTAGATADGYLLLDLEALQVTGCDGPPDLVDRVISTAATELATGQWAGSYELILVGCDELEAVGRAEHTGSLDEALRLIEARRGTARRRLADRPRSDVRQLRLTSPDDEDWTLTILVSRIQPSPSQLQRLIDLAEEGPGGVAALLAGDPETTAGRMAPTVLQVAPDPHELGGIIANVVPMQITVRPRVLSAAEYGAISTLFRVAADTADVSQDDPAYAWCAAPPWLQQPADHQSEGTAAANWPGGAGGKEDGELTVRHEALPWEYAAPELPDLPGAASVSEVRGPGPESAVQVAGRHAVVSRLQVKVLGPFVISGAVEPLQPKQAELVLALALSAPAGLTNSALGSLLGADPDHPKPGDAVRQIIARARRRLGPAADGDEYIRHTGNGHYELHPEVSLDWTQFQALALDGTTDALRVAVALIRGQPFTGSFFWWIDIPLMETVRAELVDAAVTLAELELAAGSPREAARAARAGLLAEASAEQLWRVLMRAEYGAGNLAGVREAWRSCLDSIEDVSPGGEPHPATSALYHQLTSDARQHARARG
jgi:DNA-binding SARP family transcriptional activator